MKTLLKKSAILKTISSKISTYLHEIDAVPQEDDLDFDDEEWMDYHVKPTLAHVILDLLLSPTYRIPKTVSAVHIYQDKNIFFVCPRCDTGSDQRTKQEHRFLQSTYPGSADHVA